MIRIRHLTLAPLAIAAIAGLTPSPTSSSEPAGASSAASATQVPEVAAVAAAATVDVAPPAPLAAEVVSLRRDLDQISRTSGSRNGNQAVIVVSLDRGDTLYSLNPDLPLAPASNMKLFTTAAALYYLGPNFRYSTYALADGEIRDGVLHGDLILYGTGDPAISSRMLPGALSPLRALTDSLRANGIVEIAGRVVGDGSYFDDQWIAQGWRPEYRLDSYSAPIGALSLAENVVSVRVQPGSGAGEPARVQTTPATAGLLINNRVRTVTGGGTSVRFSYDPTGLAIEGQIARGHPGVARTVTVTDPANYAAAAFRKVIEEAGIVVRGEVGTIRLASASPVTRGLQGQGDAIGTVPPRVIGTHLSPTLQEVATVTNHVSQNLFAEALFKTVGRVVLGEGSFSAGARAVLYFMECEKPVAFPGLNIIDGSGLSPDNRVTARATVHLLDLMTRTEVADVFLESLPMAASPRGGTHSLRNRMGGTPAANNLRAKTGTISNVSSLSGYVRAANGERLAFSIYVNGVPSTWQAKRMEDAVGARLARFTRPDAVAPSAAVLEEVGAAAAEPIELQPEARPVTPAEPAAAPPVTAAPAPPEPQRTHRVASGESFDVIARRYGVTTAQLQAANPGIEPRRLQIGHTLRIPGAAASTSGTRPAAPAARTHRVTRGETLDGIARRYGVSVAGLQAANGDIQPRRLQIGQTLTIPAE